MNLTMQRVAIVGGGNVAIDAARTAWRLKADAVHVIYRRTRQEMPAYQEEVTAALEEGINFEFLANPTAIIGNGRVQGLTITRQQLTDFDAGGRRKPAPIPGSEFNLEIDVLIPAIGQKPNSDWAIAAGLEVAKDGRLIVHDGLATSRPGVFAAGDTVSGPASVIDAVAQGNQVAAEIDIYLSTGALSQQIPRLTPAIPDSSWNVDDYAMAVRCEAPQLHAVERKANFKEVEQPIAEAAIRAECRRCLRCDLEWRESLAKEADKELKATA
jgi:NADPH-dependent glutamate synthase beta subunit-like oxidoreductase